ncbi:MAG: energy transducer TonB [Acidobacteria bacterium]|nr:energy transducer TonB [Acidobacteriota bacterium]
MKARQMFGEIAEPTNRVGSRKWYTVPLSIVAHVVVFGAVVVVPLIATDVLPTPATMMSFMLPAPPPVYPPVAQSARVQGIVILEAVIGPSGRVTEVTVLRSVPLLDEAAIAAVKQWEYTPTLLNGVPVPVIMTVTVNFMLQ